jgi:hypothetical protein
MAGPSTAEMFRSAKPVSPARKMGKPGRPYDWFQAIAGISDLEKKSSSFLFPFPKRRALLFKI